jgi:hypothetical protein
MRQAKEMHLTGGHLTSAAPMCARHTMFAFSQAGRHAGGPVDQDHVMDFVIRGEVCARFFELSGL